MTSKNNQRAYKRIAQKYWINPQFQGPFLIFYFSPFLALLASCLVLYPDIQVLVCGLIILFFALPLGILFSHRIAGPVYRLNQQMVRDANGHKISLIKFRQHDFFPEMAGSYNVLSIAINKERENKLN